jgi:hypothetical protein
MRIYYLFIILSIFMLTCSRNSGTDRLDNTSDKKIRKQVVAVVEKYIMNQLAEAKKTIAKNGIITFEDGQKKYVIEPLKIFTGLIDDDLETDAIVSLTTFQGQYQTISEQLIILKTENDFMLVRTIDSDMRIISLKDRIITADVPEHSRNTPLFNCQSCWEVVNFQYRQGELVRTE